MIRKLDPGHTSLVPALGEFARNPEFFGHEPCDAAHESDDCPFWVSRMSAFAEQLFTKRSLFWVLGKCNTESWKWKCVLCNVPNSGICPEGVFRILGKFLCPDLLGICPEWPS